MANNNSIINEQTDINFISKKLSMIIHHEEIMNLAKLLKEVIEEKIAEQNSTEQ